MATYGFFPGKNKGALCMPERVEWMTVEQAAQELGVHPDTIRGYIRERELPAVQLKRTYRIKREDFDEFLRRRYTGREE